MYLLQTHHKTLFFYIYIGLRCFYIRGKSKQCAQDGDRREEWLAISPFSSCRNVRRGRALGRERKEERNKGKAENRSMQFI